MSRKRSLHPPGRIVVLEYESKVLAGNALADPHVRRVGVWLPPGYDDGTVRGRSAGRGRRFPVLFDLVGFTGSGLAHLTGARSRTTSPNASRGWSLCGAWAR
jgi:hypothetical protein